MKFRRVAMALGVFGAAIVIVTNAGDAHSILAAFARVRWYVVPLVIIAQLVSYLCDAGYYRSFFAIWERKVKLRTLFEVALASNFANIAIPSGGVSGTAILASSVQRQGVGVSPAMSTLAQASKYLFTFASYLAVLVFGFVTLLFSGDLSKISVRFVILIVLIALSATAVIIIAFSERTRLEFFVNPVIRFVNHFGNVILRRKKPLISRQLVSTFLADFYKDYHWLLTQKKRWPSLFWWLFGRNIAEVATIYVVFLGFGQWANPGSVIVGYTIAIIASMSALVVGGLGAYEAGMIGTFTALGMSFALAFAVVIVYRVLNLGIFLPLSFIFYRKYLRDATDLAPAKVIITE